MEETAISFKNVFYRRNKRTILNDITGDFCKYKITAIIGPSGAGKTSLLKLCNGLNKASSGNIYINEQNIKSWNPLMLRRTVGLAFQDAKMISGSVRKNLALPLLLQGNKLTNKEAERLLHLVQLETHLLSLDVRHLSGGQRQRLALARTLINKPEILLLDEITASLDQISVKEIEQLIISINEMFSTTIIWITHDIEQAKNVAHDIWVMIDGDLTEYGPISLLEQPKNNEVKEFIWGTNK